MISVLVLDDHQEILDALKALFEAEGIHSIAVSSPSEMYDELEKANPDVLLIDVILGWEDGRDLCTKLKAHERFQHIPILLMSAVEDFHLDRMGNRVFADGCIQKPFGNNELIAKLKMLSHSANQHLSV